MKAPDEKGYRIRLTDWVGRLGNHLVQLSSAIWVAKHTESLLQIPKHEVVHKREFDFRNSSNSNCGKTIESRFLFSSECFQFPIEYDSDRRTVLQEYLYKYLKKETFGSQLRGWLGGARGIAPNEDTLVINMRSGRDIFRQNPPPQPDYMQPPLSFYQEIILSNNYDKCLIVTEGDRANPVIPALLAWNSGIEVKEHTTVQSDIATLLGANHLVLAHSSFSWVLAQMSKNLKVLHQWHHFPVSGIDELDINTYRVSNYIKPGTWTASEDQLALMINHSRTEVERVERPATSQRIKSCWM